MESGKKISVEELADIFLELQEKKAENINLVSPTIYADKIAKALVIAKWQGLKIPVIYNSNGYENIETLKMLEGLIDVYLPDLKYGDDELALKYSKVKNYFEVATEALLEMARQVGEPTFNEEDMIQKGLLVRHLVLPNHIDNTRKVFEWYKENLIGKAYISIMLQYFPAYNASKYKSINRKINFREYGAVQDYIYEFRIENGFMQDPPEEDEKKYVPKWDV